LDNLFYIPKVWIDVIVWLKEFVGTAGSRRGVEWSL